MDSIAAGTSYRDRSISRDCKNLRNGVKTWCSNLRIISIGLIRTKIRIILYSIVNCFQFKPFERKQKVWASFLFFWRYLIFPFCLLRIHKLCLYKLYFVVHPSPFSKSKFNLKSDRVNLVVPACPNECLLYLPNIRAIQ